MKTTTLVPIITAAFLAGCSDGAMLGPVATSPKHAAWLCNGDQDRASPTRDQAKVVAAFQGGEISFDECMRRLRS
jgi:hypothetical protein